MLSGILALIQAIPYLYKAFQGLVLLYVEAARQRHEQDILDGLRKALDGGDQRDLEDAIGSPNAGRPAQDQTDVVVRPRRPRREPPEGTVLVFLLLLGLSGCVTRQQVEADIWTVEPIPQSLCDKFPAFKNYGFIRVVDCTASAERQGLCHVKPDCTRLDKESCEREGSYEELLPFCAPSAKRMIAMRERDAEKWLKLLTRKK